MTTTISRARGRCCRSTSDRAARRARARRLCRPRVDRRLRVRLRRSRPPPMALPTSANVDPAIEPLGAERRFRTPAPDDERRGARRRLPAAALAGDRERSGPGGPARQTGTRRRAVGGARPAAGARVSPRSSSAATTPTRRSGARSRRRTLPPTPRERRRTRPRPRRHASRRRARGRAARRRLRPVLVRRAEIAADARRPRPARERPLRARLVGPGDLGSRRGRRARTGRGVLRLLFADADHRCLPRRERPRPRLRRGRRVRAAPRRPRRRAPRAVREARSGWRRSPTGSLRRSGAPTRS